MKLRITRPVADKLDELDVALSDRFDADLLGFFRAAGERALAGLDRGCTETAYPAEIRLQPVGGTREHYADFGERMYQAEAEAATALDRKVNASFEAWLDATADMGA